MTAKGNKFHLICSLLMQFPKLRKPFEVERPNKRRLVSYLKYRRDRFSDLMFGLSERLVEAHWIVWTVFRLRFSIKAEHPALFSLKVFGPKFESQDERKIASNNSNALVRIHTNGWLIIVDCFKARQANKLGLHIMQSAMWPFWSIRDKQRMTPEYAHHIRTIFLDS